MTILAMAGDLFVSVGTLEHGGPSIALVIKKT